MHYSDITIKNAITNAFINFAKYLKTFLIAGFLSNIILSPIAEAGISAKEKLDEINKYITHWCSDINEHEHYKGALKHIPVEINVTWNINESLTPNARCKKPPCDKKPEWASYVLKDKYLGVLEFFCLIKKYQISSVSSVELAGNLTQISAHLNTEKSPTITNNPKDFLVRGSGDSWERHKHTDIYTGTPIWNGAEPSLYIDPQAGIHPHRTAIYQSHIKIKFDKHGIDFFQGKSYEGNLFHHPPEFTLDKKLFSYEEVCSALSTGVLSADLQLYYAAEAFSELTLKQEGQVTVEIVIDPEYEFDKYVPSPCRCPTHNGPSLSYTLASFHRGDLENCEDLVNSARTKGFTTVTLVPAIEYDRQWNKISDKNKTIKRGNLTKCLQVIWDSGMNLVYQPHLDSIETIAGEGEKGWRGDFDFDPTKEPYIEEMFKEFLSFLEMKKTEIFQDCRKVDVIIAAELELSTTKYPAQWKQIVQDMRDRLKKMGVLEKVRIGFNPNYSPKYDPDTGANCSAFNDFVEMMNFIAPSFYGDWRSLTNPGSTWQDINSLKEKAIKALNREGKACQVDMFHRSKYPMLPPLPFVVGEFATGPDFKRTWWDNDQQPIEKKNLPEFKKKRRKLYENLMDWAANEPSIRSTTPYALNIWTLGIFDPVNVRGGKKTSSIPDRYIENRFKEYTRNRCYTPQ